MNLATRRQTTATKVVELPMTEHIIKAVEKMAEEQGIKSLKITGHNKQLLHLAHWVAGVDYDNNNENQAKNDEENDEDFIPEEEIYPEDDDMVEEDCYNRIDQAEIDEIFADSRLSENHNSNPMDDESDTAENPENSEQLSDDDGSDTDDQSQAANQPTTRYGRTIKSRNILTYGHHQNNPNQPKQPPKKSVKFEDNEWHQVEQQHNLFVTGAQMANKIEYSQEMALLLPVPKLQQSLRLDRLPTPWWDPPS